jgi:hypothetical protein
MTDFGVSYFGNRFLSHADRDLRRIAESCNYVVHTVSENDLMFHKAVMTRMIEMTRRLGLEVWVDPWGLGGVFGGESMSHFLLEHRNSWQIMSDGRAVPSACLNKPEWRSYVKEWILTVRDMGAQVVFWDEPHVAFDFQSEMDGVYSCYCSDCQQLFQKKYGTPAPSRLNEKVREFRRDTMKFFLQEMMVFAKSRGLRNALCLYAFKGHKEYDVVWQDAAALPELDIFGCDPYWHWRFKREPTPHVTDFSKYVVEHAKKNQKQSQIWIQSMRLPAGKENEIAQAVDAAVAQGVTHIAAWSFDGGELLDTVLSERPEVVWAETEKAFKRYRV